jgi:predicted nucleic acid-binding protein
VSIDLVFDNTPLSHFARAGRLGALEKVVAPYRCVTPAEVTNEIHDGIAEHPSLAKVLSAPWLEDVELSEIEEVVAFARYKAELGGGPDKNRGEAAVLAWASVHGDIAIIDERAGTRMAQRDGIAVHGTLWLVANGVRSERLTRSEATRIVNELAATDMALPVDGPGFFAWAYEQGLLP